MRLLLHICCAPCSIAPFKEVAKKEFVEIKGFFYNPNIHPFEEYTRRRNAVELYAKESDIEVLYPEYHPEEFFCAIGDNKDVPYRCKNCWGLRLRATAIHARRWGFDYFSTTLLISPYQDHQYLKLLGEDIAKENKINFYYSDFRPLFRESQSHAKEAGLYRQRYCGCEYSFR